MFAPGNPTNNRFRNDPGGLLMKNGVLSWNHQVTKIFPTKSRKFRYERVPEDGKKG
jgi:hypothetical protein